MFIAEAMLEGPESSLKLLINWLIKIWIELLRECLFDPLE